MAEARLTLLKPAQLLRITVRAGAAATLVIGQAVSLASVTLLQGQPILRGLSGPPGPSGDKARRHAWASPHSYAAVAAAGTLDADPDWALARITVAADGSTTVAHALGAWTDRATLTYT